MSLLLLQANEQIPDMQAVAVADEDNMIARQEGSAPTNKNAKRLCAWKVRPQSRLLRLWGVVCLAVSNFGPSAHALHTTDAAPACADRQPQEAGAQAFLLSCFVLILLIAGRSSSSSEMAMDLVQQSRRVLSCTLVRVTQCH